MGVDDGAVLLDVGEVAQRLDASAVAHAPMVTSLPEASRMSWMRSASWGVVIDPSTSETSYGPGASNRVASGK